MKFLYALAQTPNGATVSVHRLHRATLEQTRVLLTLNHYADANQELPTWQDEYEMPLEQFQMGAYPDCVWDWIASPEGLFPGGQIMDAPSDFEAARKIKLHHVNRMRDGFIAGGFEFQQIGVFETDSRSIQNIMGAVQMAMIAQSMSQPFSISWRLADNTNAILDGMTMISVGAALATYVSEVYARSWALKAEVMAAETLESLEAIELGGWPAATNAPAQPPAEEMQS